MAGEEIRTALAVIAIAVSIASLYFSRRSWLQSNRPVVTAFISEHSSGSMAATFNLIVANSGNRPATQIRLTALPSDIESLLNEKSTENRKQSIKQCFSEAAKIPLLRNGEELETAFGAFTDSTENEAWLNYDKTINITVNYADLEGRNYKSHLPLRIYARRGFGGSVWTDHS